jgi:dynein heavy chain
MHSKEGEVVEFVADCSCDGPVEVWLQNVVDSMKQALQMEFRKAIPTYDEMPRTTWFYKYSAQNTVAVSRTFFTQEVNEAFDDLEEGEKDGMAAVAAVAGSCGWDAQDLELQRTG